jgi:hypothetical protein
MKNKVVDFLHVFKEARIILVSVFFYTAFFGWAQDASIQVNFDEVILERTQSLTGANIEDLNFQIYGGLYSQLLFGESFEEDVDPSLLVPLVNNDRMRVWIVRDEKNQPIVRAFRGHPFSPPPYKLRRLYEAGPNDWNSTQERGRDTVTISGIHFVGGIALPDELPDGLRDKLLVLGTGIEQVSRHWRVFRTGSPVSKHTLIRGDVLNGKQAQQIEFISGSGEVGIDNAGLFRKGITIEGAKPYEGTLRIKSKSIGKVWVSLRDSAGNILAESSVDLNKQLDTFQKCSFTLTPARSVTNGRFVLTLKHPGKIIIDYAFLQPGEWGRFHGLPIRKDLAEAIISMGVKTLRYNGSMVNKCPDGPELYKWKQMIKEPGERPPYHGWFNPYASHGFTIFDFLDFCEAADIFPIVGLRTDETENDIADFVEYCLGSQNTTWGNCRIKNGHLKPYILKAVEIGNEEDPNEEYLQRFKRLANALWTKNRDLLVLPSVNVGEIMGKNEDKSKINNMLEMARWVRKEKQEDKFILDSHFGGLVTNADTKLSKDVGLLLHELIADSLPGFNLRLWPMEENGYYSDWARGLGHAHNLNTLNRMPLSIERVGVANLLEATDLALLYPQGLIHFDSSRIFYQPSYYVNRMFSDEWLPRVVFAESSLATVDVLAKKDISGKVLTLYIANIAANPVSASVKLANFKPKEVKVVQLFSKDLKARNTAENPRMIAPIDVKWDWNEFLKPIHLPGSSFTTIRMECP